MVTASTYQSMDHSSSVKKTRQHLQDSEFGIGSVSVDVKKSHKKIQHAKKVSIQPVKESLSHVESMISDVRRKHAQELSTFQNNTSSLRNSLSESRKELLSKFSFVDDTIAVLKEKIESLIKDNEILSELANEVSKIQSFLKKLEESILSLKKELDVFNSKEKALTMKQSEHDNQIRQLNVAMKDISTKLSYAQVAAKNVPKEIIKEVITVPAPPTTPPTIDHVKSLHIGEKFNLPEQPPVVKEGGIHKSAPLSLTVNGAVLLHDIGYTTDKKGLVPLYYDPITQRALIYQGK